MFAWRTTPDISFALAKFFNQLAQFGGKPLLNFEEIRVYALLQLVCNYAEARPQILGVVRRSRTCALSLLS
jgi:hypothetical protein